MGTKWSEIISNHAMVDIDDVRLQEEAANDPAAFLRRMSLYVANAIPLFSLPVQMRAYLSAAQLRRFLLDQQRGQPAG